MLFSGIQAGSPEKDEDIRIKAEKIHSRIISIDSHNDTPLFLMRDGFDFSSKNDVKVNGSRVDIPRMTEGFLDGAFFAAFVSQGPLTPEGNARAMEKITRIIDTIRSVVHRNPEKIELALSPADAARIKKSGKHIAFIGIENGYALGTNLSNINRYFQQGARYITVCHSKNNDLCDSSTDTILHQGLSQLGEEAVTEMNRVGMMIDVSHVSDQTFYDILKI